MTINHQEQGLASRIHPNTLRFYTLPTDASPTKAHPVDLLNSLRLDVLARVLYAKERIAGLPAGWGHYVYENLMRSWTNDFTPPREVEPGRFTMADYHQQFTALISNMSANRFADDISVIPTCEGTIVDGAHRLAAAIALGLDEVVTVELKGEPQVQDYKTLLQIGMNPAAVENMVLELMRLKKGSRIALLFPCTAHMHKQAIQYLEKKLHVDYRYDMLITFSGLKRLMDLCYGDHEWWEEVHAHRFAKRRFSGPHPLTIVCFQEDDKSVRPIKDKLRSLMDRGNDAIHTTDTHNETIAIAEVLLNEHGRDWLNIAQNTSTPRFNMLFEEFRHCILSKQATTRVCVDSGGVLAAYGLRDVTDLDYLEVGGKGSFNRDEEINCHNGEYQNTGLIESALVDDPRNHFYYRGIKFVSINNVEALKKSRGDAKDIEDLGRIYSLRSWSLHKFYISVRIFRTALPTQLRRIYTALFSLVVAIAKKVIPIKYHPLARNLYLRWHQWRNNNGQ